MILRNGERSRVAARGLILVDRTANLKGIQQAADKVPRRLGHVARRLRRRLAAWSYESGGRHPRPTDRRLRPLYPRSCEFFSTLFIPQPSRGDALRIGQRRRLHRNMSGIPACGGQAPLTGGSTPCTPAPASSSAPCSSLSLPGGTLCALGGVGVLAGTWAWLLPPTRPGTFLILGDTPRPPSEGDSPPLNSPFLCWMLLCSEAAPVDGQDACPTVSFISSSAG